MSRVGTVAETKEIIWGNWVDGQCPPYSVGKKERKKQRSESALVSLDQTSSKKKPKDNLRPEGDFERPVREQYGPGERAPIVKHADNLKPEGDFDRPQRELFSPSERPKAVKPKDNLKPEGDFERPKADKFSPAERPRAVKPQDNLKPEGDFERPSQPLVPLKGDRAEVKRYEDHRITGGDFTGITTQQVEFTGETTERPVLIRRNTWTKLEGEFTSETTSKSEFKQFDSTQRTEIVKKRADNLTVGEGTIDVLPRNKDDHPEKWNVKLEKSRKHKDNLKTDAGKFSSDTISSETFQAHEIRKKEEIRRREDNLVQEGEMTFVTSAHEEFTEKTPERVKPQRRRTWTKQDGEIFFQTTSATEFTEHSTADIRQTQIRHVDNLKTGGTFEGRPKDDYLPVTAERPQQKKPKDNLSFLYTYI
uniref:Uncharacterized protein n=1 Tax=Cacopsylla melanoneura TaxID=428564 RepID=A0A8D8YHU5_9HEMI